MVGMVEGILSKDWRRLAVNPFFFLLAVQSNFTERHSIWYKARWFSVQSTVGPES